jgi:hypothetical protein
VAQGRPREFVGAALASFGADVLNLWRPDDSEVEAFYWDTQVGMRSAYLSDTGDDRAKLDQLLQETDIFFSNRHPGHLEQVGLTADKAAAGHGGLIHAQVLLHGAEGPWATRPGFDEIGAAVSGIFALGGTLEDPKMPPMLPIVDNIVGWSGTVAVLEALRRRATEGGSYRVQVSLTRVCLWLISLGIFDKEFATTTAGSTAEHSAIPPELFTAKTPLGTYQGMTDQIEFTSLPQGFITTVLQPMGADQPEWLPRATHTRPDPQKGYSDESSRPGRGAGTTSGPFPKPLAEPGLRLSSHRAPHSSCHHSVVGRDKEIQ